MIKNNTLNFYNHIGQHQLASKMAINLLSKYILPRRRCITSTMLLNSKIKITINSLSKIDFENVMKFSFSKWLIGIFLTIIGHKKILKEQLKY
jgi:hypothetical protein